jgi:hypothetical protein
MAIEVFDTLTLVGVIQVQNPPSNYWLQFFPNEINFDTEEIMFDVVSPHRRLAPFVAPNVQGKVMTEFGYTTKTFKPAYVKPKHVVDPSRAIKRRAGEAITGEMSLQERYDACVADNMRVEREEIERRWEWMAARAVIDGAVTVSGENYPTVTVNFGRDAALTATLAGTAKWDVSTGLPLVDIGDLRTEVNRKARTSINRLTFGLDAWGSFVDEALHPQVKDLLDTRYRGSDSNFNRNVPTNGDPWEYRGSISGSGNTGTLELWTYNDEYEDDAGALQPFMDQTKVVGTGPGIQGTRCYGAIKDRAAELKAMSLFPKMWEETGDPTATLTMTQSAPLMVPAQPNGCFALDVQ